MEKFNRTLISMLSTLVNENRNDWDDNLPYAMADHNLMMLNREVNFPIGLMVGQPPGIPDFEYRIQYVEWDKSATIRAFEFASGHLVEAASRQKRNYERGLKPKEYKRGDWIRRWYPPSAGGKLGLGWVGPYMDYYIQNRLNIFYCI